VRAVRRVDQLCRNADAAAGTPDAPLQHRRHAEHAGDLADVLFLAAERERRRARDDLQAVHLRQQVDHVLRESVAEVLLIFVGTEIGERQDSD